jgi:hypothetical protein
MQEWNEKAQKEAAEKVFRMAGNNPEFRKLALTDARAAVKKATGKELPSGFKLRFVDPAGAHMTVVLPRATGEEGELSEYELVAVAGGKGGGGGGRGDSGTIDAPPIGGETGGDSVRGPAPGSPGNPEGGGGVMG